MAQRAYTYEFDNIELIYIELQAITLNIIKYRIKEVKIELVKEAQC